MGSRSVSTTVYTNTPQTASENGLALSGSNLVTGTGNFSGSQTNSTGISGSNFDNRETTNFTKNELDGGAIASAFGFGSDLIKGLFQSTKDNNATISAANAAALNFSGRAQDLVSKKENKDATQQNTNVKYLMIAGAVMIAFFVFKGRA